ncbi:MAG: LysR family transcriptional regulator [Aureliella sp.]
MSTARRYYKELRITQLRAIVELSKCRSFAATASSLELSTPSVWQQIRGLEKEFDMSLVVVKGQQVELTTQGETLVELARPVVQGFDAIRQDFSSQQAVKTTLSVAAPNDILVYDLPNTIRSYREAFPDVSLSLVDLPSNPCRELLDSGDVDLAVVGQLELEKNPSLLADQVGHFPFMLICSPGHPLLDVKSIRLEDLAKYPLIMPSVGTNSRSRIESVFSESIPLSALNVAFEASTKSLLMQYVGMDFGIAIAPVSGGFKRQLELEPLHAFIDLTHLFGVEYVVIVRRRHRYESSHQAAFREALLEHYRNETDI